LRVADVELDEGAGEALHFPRRGRLAGAQPHDYVADAHRLAGLQSQVARQAVALVEESDHRDAVTHRRGAGGFGADRLGNVDRLGLGRGAVAGDFVAAPLFLSAGGERADAEERGPRSGHGANHAWSGVQAS
jgi:hypothetical protein